MDLTQKKLSKSEWINVEIPVSNQEKGILQLIVDGYHDVNIRRNDNQSMISMMKLEATPEIEAELYKKYFEKDISEMKKKYAKLLSQGSSLLTKPEKNGKSAKPPVLKTRDMIRINSIDGKVDEHRENIFEYVILEFTRNILSALDKLTSKYSMYLYTLLQFKKATIPHVIKGVVDWMDRVIEVAKNNLRPRDVLHQAYEFIEKNAFLLKFEDRSLFDHQKQIFSLFRNSPTDPKLVLYTAPTGTGKTLTPIGLSESHRIIFICAARHVGLALAKSAVSVGKRIAVAFGCETAADIRLHYFAASEFTRNKKTGGIGKVDNSVGDKVQIMICDVQSYLIAMHYMLAFSPENESSEDEVYHDADLITYWDEPTITMDYEDHSLHALIQRSWKENRISKLVLSCATLPTEADIVDTLSDFRAKFVGATVHTISSYDCRKSIALLNKEGKSVLPHLLFQEYTELQQCAKYCSNNKSLLRYFDLKEIVRLLEYVYSVEGALDEAYHLDNYFTEGIQEITMNSLKFYYLKVLNNMDPAKWSDIFVHITKTQTPKFVSRDITKTTSMDTGLRRAEYCSNNNSTTWKAQGNLLTRTQSMGVIPMSLTSTNQVPSSENSVAHNPMRGVLLTTKDAHTLTDGPTIFLTEDVQKIGKFYIQQSNIPEKVFQFVAEKIAQNTVIQEKIDVLSKTLEDKTAKEENKEQNGSATDEKKKSDKKFKEVSSPEIMRLFAQLEELREQIRMVALDPCYVPNTLPHQRVWLQSEEHVVKNAFAPSVDEDSVRDIMALDVSNEMKLLLLLGIGMFTHEQTANPRYMEIMKRLAYEQKLFLIIASSDYIYGTNYQFCHGFVAKDLLNMTPQKTVQAMGRIGRNQTQQEYTVRFREDRILYQLFQEPTENREAIVMSRLFSSD